MPLSSRHEEIVTYGARGPCYYYAMESSMPDTMYTPAMPARDVSDADVLTRLVTHIAKATGVPREVALRHAMTIPHQYRGGVVEFLDNPDAVAMRLCENSGCSLDKARRNVTHWVEQTLSGAANPRSLDEHEAAISYATKHGCDYDKAFAVVRQQGTYARLSFDGISRALRGRKGHVQPKPVTNTFGPREVGWEAYARQDPFSPPETTEAEMRAAVRLATKNGLTYDAALSLLRQAMATI